MGRLFLLFLLVPFVDLYLLTVIHGLLGFWNTMALVIGTGLVGSWLVRLEGRRAWRAYTQALSEGRMPEEGFLGGAMLLLGGALLISPGVITDAVGLVLLIPFTRKWLAGLLKPYLARRVAEGTRRGTIRIVTMDDPFTRPRPRPEAPREISAQVVGRRVRPTPSRAPEIIDADFEVADD